MVVAPCRRLQGEMSRQGYRTLLVAWREISVQEYEEWQDSYNAASVSHFQYAHAQQAGACMCAPVAWLSNGSNCSAVLQNNECLIGNVSWPALIASWMLCYNVT